MSKKKKAGGGKKTKDGEEEDMSVENLMRAYKRNCQELGCDMSKIMKERYEDYFEEGEPITKVKHFQNRVV